MITRYLRENGYQGVIPEVLLTDEAHSFTVDSKDKETGAKRREKIYFSINDIADPNLAFSRLFGHEKAHMNTYDEGKYGEETSIHTREKIGSENKNKVFTEEEKTNYLNNLRNKYKNQKSIEQRFAEAKLVPEKNKKHYEILVAAGIIFYVYGPEIAETTVKYEPLFLSMMLDPPEINKEDEIDNLDDIKNYKSRVISNKENEILDNDEDTLVMLTKGSTKNEKDPFKKRELKKELFWKMSPLFSIYHNGYITKNGEVGIYTNPKNEKWVNEKGEEQIFNIETVRIVKDGINNGTFNIAGNDKNSFNLTNIIAHFRLDVTRWENYGIGKNDILTKEQRKKLSEMGSKYVKDPIFRIYIDSKGGKLTESTYHEYLKFEEAYREQF